MKLTKSIISYFVYYHSFLCYLLIGMSTGGGFWNALFDNGPEFVLTETDHSINPFTGMQIHSKGLSG